MDVTQKIIFPTRIPFTHNTTIGGHYQIFKNSEIKALITWGWG